VSDYHKLPIAEKQALSRERMRESAVACPACETQTTASDLLNHIDQRCPGAPPDPAPHSKWVSMAEVQRMGVSKQLLSYWYRSGHVRARGEVQARKYLFRDVATRRAKQLFRSRRRR
jgi:hypothetical protein